MTESKKLFLSWDDLHHHTYSLCEKLKTIGKWNKLVCVSRGGLAPSALVSRYLDIKDVDTICLSSYDHNHRQDEVEVIKAITSDSSEILVIDDLVDTGKSFIAISKMLPNAHKTCIYGKPNGIPYADSYFMDVPQSTWIVFPWER
jgi:xanthine phosphoribosyltransferase